MFGFNWIDIIIVLLLIWAAYAGGRMGVLAQVMSSAGFFAALFAAGWILPHILPFHNPTVKSIVNASLVLIAAAYAGKKGFERGQDIHWSFRLGRLIGNKKLKAAEKWLGVLPAVAGCLALVWLLGVSISRLPFAGFSNSVSDSLIFRTLADTLPPAPAVFAGLDRRIDPNGQPYVTEVPKPYKDFNYSPGDVEEAAAKAVASVVRITSFGCGGLVSGSGFIAGHHLVATNAHVVAGVKRPIIKYQNDSYEGIPVYFDPGLDIAILRADQLKAPPLRLATTPISSGTVAVLGYPGGNYRTLPGIIRDNLQVDSRNIYGVGSFPRDAYGIQTAINDGSSGGPVVTSNGRAIGMIFSQSTASRDYAYALSASYIAASLKHVGSSNHRVNNGVCTVN